MLGQRRYERVAFFCPVELTVLQTGATIPGESFDISLAGVGISTTVILDRGQPVRVRFHLQDGTDTKIAEEVLGRVAYSRADEDGNRLGIEFLQVVQESAQPALARRLHSL